MIVNVSRETFGGAIRNGDLIAVANIVEHLRKNIPGLKFYLTPGTLFEADYVHKMHQFFLDHTDYFSLGTGTADLPWKRVNIWDFRDVAGDVVKIPNNQQKQKKIVVCPVFDAKYNTYRNWPMDVFEKILNECDQAQGYEKIILQSDNTRYRDGWIHSSDFNDNLMHIMQAEIYVGGDTGLSHFVGALEHGPQPVYYTSSRGLLHTTPFYWYTHKKGTMKTYWLDFERTEWQ